jgi:cell division protease FtsH
VTFSAPDADRYSLREGELSARIKVALGGRVAEELVFKEPSTGAESDIRQLTEVARGMVARWGMSDAVGMVAVTPPDGATPFTGVEASQETRQIVDQEVRRIAEQARIDVEQLLRENRTRLDSLALALLDHETLDEADAYAAAGLRAPGAQSTGSQALAAFVASPRTV